MLVKDPTKDEWWYAGRHRNSNSMRKRLAWGVEGQPDNFEFSLYSADGNATPSHKHNFSQFRFVLDGYLPYTRSDGIRPGEMVYIPEGVRYGPFEYEHKILSCSLQFGGPSGNGFLSYEELDAGAEELLVANEGWRDKGMFCWTGPDGKVHRKDGYQAVWEYKRNAQMIYPAPRYAAPLKIIHDAFPWVPTSQPGVDLKRLGVFDERGTAACMFQVQAGASLALNASMHERVLLVVSNDGAGILAGGSVAQRHSGIYLPPGEFGELQSDGVSSLLMYTLPLFKGEPRWESHQTN